MRDKLTPLAILRNHQRPIGPFLVRAKPGMLRELIEDARAFEIGERFTERRRVAHFFYEWLPFSDLGFGIRVIRRFDMIAGIFPREVVWDMAEWRSVERIYPDEVKWILGFEVVPPEGVYEVPRRIKEPLIFTSTYWTKKLIGADEANSLGYTGRGVYVGVLDTGARRTHEQLRGRVEFESVMKGQYADANGHGSWCTTCIGGGKGIDNYLTRKVGRPVICEGMAPESQLLAVKCLGYGVGMGSDSSIISALALAADRGVDIVSLSLGGPVGVESVEDDPYLPVFDEVVKSGVIPVVAAGNSGPEPETIATPGWLPNVLTVGAIDPVRGEVASFSSRGPTVDGRIKPDCVAPGVNVDSGTVGMCDYAGDDQESRYSPISGTSMATPHVSGLVALMVQAIRERAPWMRWNLDRTFDMLEKTAVEPKSPDYGWGLITWRRFVEYCETELGIRI